MLKRQDVNGDGVPDFILDYGEIECPTVAARRRAPAVSCARPSGAARTRRPPAHL
jgi:hypothetical protein